MMVSFLVSLVLTQSAQSPNYDRGYIAAKFGTTSGGVTVYLPNDLAPGDPVTGSVLVDSSSDDLKDLRADIGDVHGVRIPKTSLFRWNLPKLTVDNLPLIVYTKDGRQIGALRIPIAPNPGRLDAFTFPNFVQSGRPAIITGPFDGDATTAKLNLGDVSASILAESPRSMVTYVPYSTKSGSTKAKLEKGNYLAAAEIRTIGVDLSSPQTNLRRGQKTTISVDISGLTGLDAASVPFIRLENLSPKTLDLQGQAIHHIIPKVTTNGTFHIDFAATSIESGSFLITSFVEPGPGIPVLPSHK